MKAKCKTKTAPMKLERKNEIVVYQPDEVMRLEVRVLDESVWLTQAQIAELFGTKRPAITKHLANIYKTGELEKDGTCSILEHMGHAGSQQYRFLFIDNKRVYLFGASLKDLGKKCFCAMKIEGADIAALKALT